MIQTYITLLNVKIYHSAENIIYSDLQTQQNPYKKKLSVKS